MCGCNPHWKMCSHAVLTSCAPLAVCVEGCSLLVVSHSVLTLHEQTHTERKKDVELAPALANEAVTCMTGAECHVGHNYAALALTLFFPSDSMCLRKCSPGLEGQILMHQNC